MENCGGACGGEELEEWWEERVQNLGGEDGKTRRKELGGDWEVKNSGRKKSDQS